MTMPDTPPALVTRIVSAAVLKASSRDNLLAAPCLFCGYNGPGYYQAGTHATSCPWSDVGGSAEREGQLSYRLEDALSEAPRADATGDLVQLQQCWKAARAERVKAEDDLADLDMCKPDDDQRARRSETLRRLLNARGREESGFDALLAWQPPAASGPPAAPPETES